MNEKHDAPQTDDLAVIEQWQENQEAQAVATGIPEPIAVNGPVGIECPHGYDACPECDEVAR